MTAATPTPRKPGRPRRPLSHQQLGDLLEATYRQHNTAAFRNSDPIRLPWQYAATTQTCEMVAFLTAMFAYGRRELIIQAVSGLLTCFGEDPAAFIANYDDSRDYRHLKQTVYRFYKTEDIRFLLSRMQVAYARYGSLQNLWAGLAAMPEHPTFRQRAAAFMDALLGEGAANHLKRNGSKFMFPHPGRGSACKRLNMFFRWMARTDNVDLGLWGGTLSPADLVMPLDTHVMRMNGLLRLTSRQTPDWQTAEAMAARLKSFNPTDPLRYDIALMGLGLSGLKTPSDLRAAHFKCLQDGRGLSPLLAVE
ncbi:MAG: TIGR02757 family protein [Candidatus Melainabacteria bacterium]